MTFDPGVGEVRWTPPLSAVEGGDRFARYNLNIKLSVEGQGEETLSASSSVVLLVASNSAPLDINLMEIDVEPRLVTLTEGSGGELFHSR